MDAKRWQKIKKLFNEAVEQPLNQRRQFLVEACDGDEMLRKEVESLLLSDGRAASFIEESVVGVTERAFDAASRGLAPGERLGAYQIKNEIGRGGMGAVFLAERADDEFYKKAAVKILRFGLETEQAVARFRRERQILAALEHPNIARLLDGGTMPGGMPFYVMEYIEGEPIDKYCDRNKLSVNERLKLFLKVCDAVHFAHQNQIVHRDIKPGNILVGADGIPKLLDFGIAKLLDTELAAPDLRQTATAWRLMTPEYASPEQIKGEEITPATDIYSLGVMLYELLTGHLPYRVKKRFIYEIARAVCEQEPEKPSASVSRIEEITTGEGIITLTPDSVSHTREGNPDKLRRRLKGDLDHIALLALRKEPGERYSTVEEFAGEIQHYLEGLPLASRKGAFSYRIEKFTRRNKVRVAVVVLILIILFVGGGIAFRQSRTAEVERLRRTEAEAERERQFALLNPDYILIKDNPSLNPQRGITISLWFKTSRTKYDQQLVSKFQHTNDTDLDDSFVMVKKNKRENSLYSFDF